MKLTKVGVHEVSYIHHERKNDPFVLNALINSINMKKPGNFDNLLLGKIENLSSSKRGTRVKSVV